MIDIFISYASDDRPEAAALARFLEEKGYKVWWDRELVAGQDFHVIIERMLDECKVAIVIWSDSSIKSRWVLGEAEAAANQHKLVPARVNSLPPSRLPVAFRTLHTVTLENRSEFLAAIRSHLTAPPTAVSRRQIAAARIGRAVNLLRRSLTPGRIAVAALSLALLGYFGFDAVDWLNIRDSLSAEDFKKHLQGFPVSPFAASARAKLAGLSEWEAIQGTKDPSEIEAYLKQYSDSIYGEFARLRLERLQAIGTGKYRPVIPDSHDRALDAKDLLPLSCDDLWTARNEIFYALGYCFVTDAGVTKFRTARECPYQACRTVQTFNAWINDEIVSKVERANVEAIQKMEIQKGCRVSAVPGACSR
jgi:hypothetical protein